MKPKRTENRCNGKRTLDKHPGFYYLEKTKTFFGTTQNQDQPRILENLKMHIESNFELVYNGVAHKPTPITTMSLRKQLPRI